MFTDFSAVVFVMFLVTSFTYAVYATNRSHGEAVTEALSEAVIWGVALLIYTVVDFFIVTSNML
ncbi:MAG: hypothetical protein AB1400_08430 [Pseudomonadota bacterium]